MRTGEVKALVVASAPSEIRDILDYVHDRPFELSKVRFNATTATVEIPLTVISNEIKDFRRIGFIQTWKVPIYEAELRIRNAAGFHIKDEAQIDEGIINTISYRDGCISIICSVPVEVAISVSGLALELAVSGIQRGEKKGFALGFAPPVAPR